VIDEQTHRLLALAVVVVTVGAGIGGSHATLALLSDDETVGVTFSAATDYDASGNVGSIQGTGNSGTAESTDDTVQSTETIETTTDTGNAPSGENAPASGNTPTSNGTSSVYPPVPSGPVHAGVARAGS
jgi:hypothetical protein